MAPINMKCRVTLPYVTGLPSDVAVNTWSVRGEAAEVDDISLAFVNFYNTDNGGPTSFPIAKWISSRVSRGNNACKVDVYERIPAAPDGPPIATRTFTLGATDNIFAHPSECAVALSMKAAGGAGANLARRRGRVFIGPLAEEAGLITIAEERVNPQLQADLVTAIQRLVLELETGSSAQLQIWSSMDNVGRDVVEGFIDNAFDTIRSRGPKTTARVLYAV